MEYKKLTNEGFSSCVTKIIAILGLVLSIFMWVILFCGLYRLNNEISVLKAEQEKLIYKIFTRHEFDFGHSPEQGSYDYYDYHIANDDDDDDDDDDDTEENKESAFPELQGGGDYTKDGLESKRLKRDIIGTTADGVPVNAESYAEVKRKNRTRAKQPYHLKSHTIPSQVPVVQANHAGSVHNVRNEKLNVGSTPPTSQTVVYNRRSRVMHNNSKQKNRRRYRRPMVKSLNSNNPDQTISPDPSILQGAPHRKRHRQRRVESSSRLRPAIHLNGEVSSLAPNYGNYLGNGRMHHYNQHFKNWTKELWVDNLGMDDYFQMHDGYLRFLDSGLYYVYAQIYYVDEHDTNGFGIYKNNDLVLQCTTTSHTNHRVIKPNTCYTGGVIAFSNGDLLKVHDIEANRYSIFQKGKSFFGAVKLGEISET